MSNPLYPVRQASIVVFTLAAAPAAAAPPRTQPGPLPRVLIIGDSISIGYTDPVAKILSGKAETRRIPTNGGDTWKGLRELDAWLGDTKWDVIHFNWGLHDLKHLNGTRLDIGGKRVSTAEEYERNLDALVKRLKATGARLIWASTTPIPDGAAGRLAGQEAAFNRIARTVMDAHGVRVNDLHTYIRPRLADLQQPRNVHFTREGYRFLAERVARCILSELHNPEPPFPMPDVRAPRFPGRTFDVRSFGAVADGRSPANRAIADAIAACAAAGGGRVFIPPGTWLTGAIHLRSNVELHLAEGAELRFSTDPRDYLPPVFVRWGGFECYNYSPLIYANGCENIAVTGPGRIEGQGRPWWGWVKEQDRVARALYGRILEGVPVGNRVYGNTDNPLRPQLFQPINCRNVHLEGVTITAGPFWTVQFVYCENVLVQGVTIINDGPNNDGINADSSRNIVIERCTFATGDDSVAIKSGLNEDGWRVGRPSENIVVRHCRMKRGHGGVVIGSDMSGGVRNVFVHDCDFSGSLIGIRLKSTRGRGGVVEDVWYEDIEMGTIPTQAICLHTDYRAWFGSDRGRPPLFRNIHIRRATCEDAKEAVRIAGLPEQPFEGVTLEDITAFGRTGITCTETQGLTLRRVSIGSTTRPVLTLHNVRGATIGDFRPNLGEPGALRIGGDRSADIRVDGRDASATPTHPVPQER